MTDQEIIALQRSGDYNQAFNAIVGSYSERLFWHVRRFLCSHDDTNDLLQDIFIKIWKALPSFKGDSRIYTWIYRIATNEVLNYLRKRKVKAMMSLEAEYPIVERMIDNDPYFNGNELQRELHKQNHSGLNAHPPELSHPRMK